MRACPLPLRDASKTKALYVGSVEKLKHDADRRKMADQESCFLPTRDHVHCH
jgi:hypothetical protein